MAAAAERTRAAAGRGLPLALPPARGAHAGDRSTPACSAPCATSRRRCASRCRCRATSATATTSPAAPPWTPAATRSASCASSPAPSPRSRSAEARLAAPNVDRWMTAELAFPDGRQRPHHLLAVLRHPAQAAGHRPRRARRDARLQPVRAALLPSPQRPHPRRHQPPNASPATPPTRTSCAPSSPPSATAPPTPTDAGERRSRTCEVIDAVYAKAGLPRRGT